MTVSVTIYEDRISLWNCAHIANAAISRYLEEVCRERGFQCPIISTPEEFL
jgi:hypothetical protein